MVSSAEWLREAYPIDLEASLSDELLQFSAFLKTDFAERLSDAPAVSPAQSVAPTSRDDAEPVITMSLELHMYRLIVANNMEIAFPIHKE